MQLNTWLTIWAAAGPILTGAVSQWWSRRRQVQDREYESFLEQKRLDAIKQDTSAAAIQQDRKQQLDWCRQTFIDFFSASYDFVWRGGGGQEPDIRERHRERFTKSFSVLMLLDQISIGQEAIAVWNACHESVNAMAGTDQQAMNNTATKLREARDAFSLKGNQLILEQIGGISTPHP